MPGWSRMSGYGADRKCWHGSLPAAIGGNAENICSPRVLLTVVESECGAGGFRPNISVAAPFVWRCLTSSPVAPVSTPTGSPGAVTCPRFPQNVACGFPAPRSSAVGSQYCELLQLPIWEAQFWRQQRCPFFDLVVRLPVKAAACPTATTQHPSLKLPFWFRVQ